MQALHFAHQSVSNPYIQGQFVQVTKSVKKGGTCSAALENVDAVLKKRLEDWISVIASGEKTGTLEEVFGVSREHIAESLKDSFDKFQKVIEPSLIIMVGIMVLCISLDMMKRYFLPNVEK